MKSQVSNLNWSPDATHLRFDTSEGFDIGGQHLTWEVSSDGKNLHQLFAGWHDPPDECCGKWTADGKYFVFQSHSQIWALPQEYAFFRREAKPVQLTSSPMLLYSPIPGKDGKKLFVVGPTYRGELTPMIRSQASSSYFSQESPRSISIFPKMVSGAPTPRIPREPSGAASWMAVSGCSLPILPCTRLCRAGLPTANTSSSSSFRRVLRLLRACTKYLLKEEIPNLCFPMIRIISRIRTGRLTARRSSSPVMPMMLPTRAQHRRSASRSGNAPGLCPAGIAKSLLATLVARWEIHRRHHLGLHSPHALRRAGSIVD